MAIVRLYVYAVRWSNGSTSFHRTQSDVNTYKQGLKNNSIDMGEADETRKVILTPEIDEIMGVKNSVSTERNISLIDFV